MRSVSSKMHIFLSVCCDFCLSHEWLSSDVWRSSAVSPGPTQGMEVPCLQEGLAAGELERLMMELGHSIGALLLYLSVFFSWADRILQRRLVPSSAWRVKICLCTIILRV